MVESFDVVAIVEEDVGRQGGDGDTESGILRMTSEKTSGEGLEASRVGGMFAFGGQVGDGPKGWGGR